MKQRIKLHLLKVLLLIAFLFLAYIQWHKEGALTHKTTQNTERLSDKFSE